MSVFVEKVYCVSFVQNHENKSLGISKSVILVPFLDMMFFSRVVLSDVLGGKDVVEGRDGRTDGRTCRIVIGRIRVKTDLPPQIRFYILPLVNTVG
jgi:hypothetical protein